MEDTFRQILDCVIAGEARGRRFCFGEWRLAMCRWLLFTQILLIYERYKSQIKDFEGLRIIINDFHRTGWYFWVILKRK
jgi:hypothetical protein